MADSSLSFTLPPQWQARIERHVTVERVIWLLTAVLFLVAWNRGLHLLYALFAFLLTAMLLSYAGAWWQLRKLSCELKLPGEAHAGRPVKADIRLKSPGKRYLLTVSLPDPKTILADASPAVFDEFNTSGRQALPVTFARRGLHGFDRVTVSCCFPFGLVRLRKELMIEPVECVVYPRVSPLRQLPVQHLLGSQVDGDIPQHQQKGEEEFAMVRGYRDGDEMRHIHWRMSAKYDEWIVKEFDSTKMPSMAVILNTDPAWVMDGPFDPREHMLEVVASLADKCAQEGCGLLVALDASGLYQVKPYQRDLQPLLYKLALWQGEPAFEAEAVLPKLESCPLIIRFSNTADGRVRPLPLMAHQHQIDIRFDAVTYPTQAETMPVRKSQQGRVSQQLVGSTSLLWELF